MQTVVLAAGEGTRLRPLTATRPKPLVPVAGRPLVGHTLRAAADAGASRLVVVVGYEGTQVRETVGEACAGLDVEFVVQERRDGTADAVRAAADALEPGPFVVLNGDDLYDAASLAPLYEGGPAVGGHRVADPTQYGVLETEGDRVTGVVEKPPDPPSNLVNVGAYRFPAGALDLLDVPRSERGEYELTDVLARVCRERAVELVEVDRWLDVGRPWELLAANEWKLADLDRRVDGDVSADAHLDGRVVVEAGARVDPGVVIEGPALVRSGARVGPNAYLRGATLVGPDARVGHAVEVKNSVLMAGASAGHLAYVGDSVLGAGVNLGAGTTVANLRHDGATVETTVRGDRVDTGRRKFGAVLGDGAKTGVGTTLDPGATLAAGAWTVPGERVRTE
jgi:bifunctional UDP-N-acetylglucosamine pyrophosphorylase/glucosamine-1-phosphate N-acetyltransferase